MSKAILEVLVTDSSGQHIGPNVKGQAVQEEFFLQYQPTPRKIPEEQRPQIHRRGNLKSGRQGYS
jgi:hypothetical protein